MGSYRRGRRSWRRAPSVVAGRRQADDPKDQIQGQDGLGAGDRAQDACFGLTLGEALADETEPGGSQECEQKADGRGQDSRPSFHLFDGAEQLFTVMPENFEADDVARTTAFPTGNGRAGYVEFVPERASAGSEHLLSAAVVVRATVLRGRAKSGVIGAGCRSGSPEQAGGAQNPQ